MSGPAPAPPQDERLNRYVGFSVSLHVLLVLIFTVKAVFFSGEPIVYESAVRVDLIGLPDKVAPEVKSAPLAEKETKPDPGPKPLPAKAETKPESAKKDPDAINLDRTRDKQKDALAKLKQMDALEKIQKELESENARKAQAERAKAIKGNVISSGSQLTGLARIQADDYIGEVERKIRENWRLPQWLARKNLKAQVRVRFDEAGKILAAQIVKSSGNPAFDEIVVDTVQKSAPLPAPPQKFARLMNLEGILFGFPE